MRKLLVFFVLLMASHVAWASSAACNNNVIGTVNGITYTCIDSHSEWSTGQQDMTLAPLHNASVQTGDIIFIWSNLVMVGTNLWSGPAGCMGAGTCTQYQTFADNAACGNTYQIYGKGWNSESNPANQWVGMVAYGVAKCNKANFTLTCTSVPHNSDGNSLHDIVHCDDYGFAIIRPSVPAVSVTENNSNWNHVVSSGTSPFPVPSLSITTTVPSLVLLGSNSNSYPQTITASGFVGLDPDTIDVTDPMNFMAAYAQSAAGTTTFSMNLHDATTDVGQALVALQVTTASSSNDVYIGNASAGTGDGSSCANQRAASYFNTAGNWSLTPTSTQIGPNTTVHFCGTISTQLTAQGSGTSGNPIKFLFESGAKISLPSCDNTNGCLNIDGKSYITIDGGIACGPGTACATAEDSNYLNTSPGTGTIEATLNGSTISTCLGGTCSQLVSSRGISAVNADNIEIKNILIRNMFVHTSCFGNSDPNQCLSNVSSDSGIFFGGNAMTSFSIHDSTIHDGRELITFAPGSVNTNGPTVYNVNLSRTAGAYKIANSNGNVVVTGISFHDSHIHDLFNWDAGDCSQFHLDGLHFWSPIAGSGGAGSTGTNTSVNIYNNTIDGNFGGCQTGTMFLEGENDNVSIYNNLIKTTYTQNNNGMMNVNGNNFSIYNNTIIGAGASGDGCFKLGRPNSLTPTITGFKNNIVANCNTLFQYATGKTLSYSNWDNNVWGGVAAASPFVYHNDGTTCPNGSLDADCTMTFTQFKTYCSSCDSHGSFGSSGTYVAVNSNGTLQSTSPARAANATFSSNNLTSLGISTLNVDKVGTSRPASGAWDAGAFQSTTSSAVDFYFASAAAGAGTGTSCTDAYAYNSSTNGLNTTTNNKWVGGNFLHLCGTFTGAAGSTLISAQGNGSAGSPITVVFEPGAILQAPYFAPDVGGVNACGGGLCIQGRSYITIDGGTNGIVQNTDNGTGAYDSGSYGNQHSTLLVDAHNCTNCIIKNLAFKNAYVRTHQYDFGPSGTRDAVTIDETQMRCLQITGSNNRVTTNTFDKAGWCLMWPYGNGDTNNEIDHNTFSNFAHAIMIADSAGNAATNFFVHDNYFPGPGTTWDGRINGDGCDPSAAGGAHCCPFHQDGIHAFGNNAGTSSMDGFYSYNNKFDGSYGLCPTGWVFVEGGVGTPARFKNTFWWNNVGIIAQVADAVSSTGFVVNTNGWITLASGVAGTQKVLNNTVVGTNSTDNTLAWSFQDNVSLSFENNIVTNVGDPIRIESSTIGTMNFNVYGPSCANGGNCFIWNGSFTGSFANWKTSSGEGSTSIQTNTPGVNANGTLQSTSPARNLGTNLTSSCTGSLSPLCTDYSGVARPNAAWDAGAFQFSSVAPPPPTRPHSTIFAYGAWMEFLGN